MTPAQLTWLTDRTSLTLFLVTVPRTTPFPITTPGPTPPDKAISIWEDDNPNSLLNRIGVPAFSEAARKAKQDFPELFEMSEDQLFKELRFRLQQPTPTDHAIRLRMWMEYEDCLMARNKKCRLENAYGSFMEKTFFYTKYTKRPTVLAWLMCPPTAYNVKIEEALHASVNQMRSILDRPVEDENGKLNTKLVELQIKIYALLDARVNGGFKQTIEQKTVSLNIGSSGGKGHDMRAQSLTMEDIDKRLQQLATEDKYQGKLKAKQTITIEQDQEQSHNGE